MNRYKICNYSIRLYQILCCCFLVLLATESFAQSQQAQIPRASDLLIRPSVQKFIDEMVLDHAYNRQKLTSLFAQYTFLQKVIHHMTHPREALSWDAYRKLYLTPKRVKSGLVFWQKYSTDLARAQKKYGVPASVITAFIGVESNYGNFTGRFPIFDTLATLAFNYPARSVYFKSELVEFLLFAREKKIDPLNVYSSYAGAIGLPQFMPSSFREYAVDFSGSGDIDLWGEPVDAIGSVASYLKEHGWETGQSIIIPASIKGFAYKKLVQHSHKATLGLKQLQKYGIHPLAPLAKKQLVRLIVLRGAQRPEFWLGLTNYYVVTTYNRSTNYAMVIYLLSKKLQAEHSKKVEVASEKVRASLETAKISSKSLM